MEGGRLHPRVAESDRDGRGDEGQSGCDVAQPGNHAVSVTDDASPSRRDEGQTPAGESLLVRHANLVRLPHTVFALPFPLLGVVPASWRAPVTWRPVALAVLPVTDAPVAALR